jgi:hypothetical protein
MEDGVAPSEIGQKKQAILINKAIVNSVNFHFVVG